MKRLAKYLNEKTGGDYFKVSEDKWSFLDPIPLRINGHLPFQFDGIDSFPNLQPSADVGLNVDKDGCGIIEVALEACPTDEEYSLPEFAESWRRLYAVWWEYVNKKIGNIPRQGNFFWLKFHHGRECSFRVFDKQSDSDEVCENMLYLVGYMDSVFTRGRIPYAEEQNKLIGECLTYLWDKLK